MKLYHDFDVYENRTMYLARNTREWKKTYAKVPPIGKKPPKTALGQVEHHTWVPNDGLDGPHSLFVIWIGVERLGSHDTLVNTIAHESFHAAGAILESTSATYNSASEPMAYLVGFISQWLYERCAPMLTPSQKAS